MRSASRLSSVLSFRFPSPIFHQKLDPTSDDVVHGADNGDTFLSDQPVERETLLT